MLRGWLEYDIKEAERSLAEVKGDATSEAVAQA